MKIDNLILCKNCNQPVGKRKVFCSMDCSINYYLDHPDYWKKVYWKNCRPKKSPLLVKLEKQDQFMKDYMKLRSVF